jgi:hypothetical protein
MTYLKMKEEFLAELHNELEPQVSEILKTPVSHQDKAKAVNGVIGEASSNMRSRIADIKDPAERQNSLIVLQYCLSVVSLEYRHRVWPYEYMAFSRRIGELWERLCAVCWDAPSRNGLSALEVPSFAKVTKGIKKRILTAAEGSPSLKTIEEDVDILVDLVGTINMREDQVFAIDGVPQIVDFKSGFGSNEKGNTLRLLGVARAYKLWDHRAQLFLLVRQEKNNNYLNVLRRSELWEVCAGEDAYKKIDELTGANFAELRREIIDFDNDLSKKMLSDIDAHLASLRDYLKW